MVWPGPRNAHMPVMHSRRPVLSPATWSVLAPPVVPVRGSDGLVHLGYELLFLNTTDRTVKIESVAVVDPDDGDRVVGTIEPMATMRGTDVTGLLRRLGVTTSPDELVLFSTLEAGKGGTMYLDVTFPGRAGATRTRPIRTSRS